MNNEWIFVTQIISLITYVGTAFGLYMLLVKQKNSTIELLKEKSDFLKMQVDKLKEESPDILADRLAKRVVLLKGE